MQISLVAAMAADRVIGKDGQMPWHLPEELQHFKAITLGKPVIMGRRTFESIGRPLPGRHNIVISRQKLELPEGVSLVSSPEEALAVAAKADEVMIIGGGEIYRQFMPYASRMYLTMIALEVDGDTRFPAYEPDEWTMTLLREHPGSGIKQPPFSAFLLEKRADLPTT